MSTNDELKVGHLFYVTLWILNLILSESLTDVRSHSRLAPMYHILLVEDNLSHAKLIFRHLQKMDDKYRCTHLSDGEAAYEYLSHCDFAKDPVHLILLDLRLPRIDGLELLRRIRQEPLSLMLPVVMLTSSERDEDIRQAYAAGANSYLVKPVAYDQIDDLLSHLTSYWFQHNRIPSLP